jgi:hypothetical protein
MKRNSVCFVLTNIFLTMLRRLFLNDNELTGTIPMELSHMSYLSIFMAENNGLIGSIPSELVRLEILDKHFLLGNNLDGSIPDGLCMCGSIDMLWVDSTVVCGCCSMP